MEDVAALFNDAGVRILLSEDAKQYYQVALDLFRGALETKLALEVATQHHHTTSQLMPEANLQPGNLSSLQLSEQQLLYTTPAASEIIRRAAMHMNQLDVYLTPRASLSSATDSSAHYASYDPIATLPSASELGNVMTLPLRSYGYKPFLCTFPLMFAEEMISPVVVSSVIVFRLGLVHQLMDRHSPKAADFYTISAALLTSEFQVRDTILLRVSLLNNFGVWCFENGDGESMRVCMEHLTVAMDGEEREETCMINDETIRKIRGNILWLLTPPNGASPAA